MDPDHQLRGSEHHEHRLLTRATSLSSANRSDADEVEAYRQRLAEITIGTPRPLPGPIELSDHDPGWPDAYRREAARVSGALGPRALRLEHAGSTSVPGLPAKPIIDMILEVPNSSDEPAYVPGLQATGYALHIREPDWFEHRLFKDPLGAVNLHVFSHRCPETDRMLQFRDRLRDHSADRDLYARCKRRLAGHDWTYMQQYADAKTEVITAILARAQAAPAASRSGSPDAVEDRRSASRRR